MRATALLALLTGVRQTSRGWSALCPGHFEKTPSLSICEGEDGRILLHDFAGCTPRKIVAALGLELKDLFAGAPLPKGKRPTPQPAKVNRRSIALQFEVYGVLLKDRAEAVLQAASGLDAMAWSDHDFDVAMGAVVKAQDDRTHAAVLFDVADSQREKAFQGEQRG